MKKKISTTLGVALALALVFALGVPLVPVAPDNTAAASPAALKWEKVGFPEDGADGSYFRSTDITALGPIAKAIDDTLYCYVEWGSGTDYLFKSTDEGRTWSKKSKYLGSDIVDIACSPEDADVLYIVSDANKIYKTDDAGASFAELSTVGELATSITAEASIKSIDAGFSGGDPYLFVGTSDDSAGGGAFKLDESTYGASWTDLDIGSYDVLEIKCSPNFATESTRQLVAVVTTTDNTSISYKYGGGAWGATIANVELNSGNTSGFQADVAALDFPDDYDSDEDEGTLEFFVAIKSMTDGDGGAGLYRITSDEEQIALSGTDLISIAVTGDVGSAVILAGTDTGTVYRSNDGLGEEVYDAKKAPSGDGNAYVVMADDYVDTYGAWVAVSGSDEAVSRQIKDRYWNQISLIDTDLDTVDSFAAPISDIQFMITTPSSGSNDSVWKWDGDVGYWERTECEADIAGTVDWVACSPDYDSDTTVFLADLANDRIYRSTDGGDRFQYDHATEATPTGWVIIDSSTLIIGVNGGTYKTTNYGTTWGTVKTATDAGDIVSFALQPGFDIDDSDNDTILAGGTGTEKIYRSTDGGTTWKNIYLCEFTGSGATYVAFAPDYATTDEFYAGAGDTVGIYDNGDDWDEIYTTAGTISGLAVSDDHTLYATDSTGAIGVLRTLRPYKAVAAWCEFENVDYNLDAGTYLDSLSVVSGTSNILWCRDSETAEVWRWEDTMIGPVTGAEATLVKKDSVTLSWSAKTGASKYEVEVNSDSSEYGATLKGVQTLGPDTDVTGDDSNPVRTTAITVKELDSGATYYFRVRVNTDTYDVHSHWSTVGTFTTKLVGGEWNPFLTASLFPGNVAPAPGATNVPLKPGFQWNAADWATHYELVLADNPRFDTPIVEKLFGEALTTTAHEYVYKELDYSTTYYWKVRAIKLVGVVITTQSPWGTGIFTTIAEPAAPAAAVYSCPVCGLTFDTQDELAAHWAKYHAPLPPEAPAPAPATPMYVWAIIGIGAVLVIAVIVLIVRTRRVA